MSRFPTSRGTSRDDDLIGDNDNFEESARTFNRGTLDRKTSFYRALEEANNDKNLMNILPVDDLSRHYSSMSMASDEGAKEQAAALAKGFHNSRNNVNTGNNPNMTITPITNSENLRNLETYRLEAQASASRQCEENTGYNPREAAALVELQQRNGNDTNNNSTIGMANDTVAVASGAVTDDSERRSNSKPAGPKPKEPPIKRPEPREPPMPPSRVHTKFTDIPRGPEMVRGIIVEDEANFNNDMDEQHISTCLGLGCKQALCVPNYASLMTCPKCHTVSPASFTRQ